MLALYIGYRALNILYPIRYSAYIAKYAELFDLPVSLVYAVINTESRFDPAAVSHRGASGLMQIMPATAEDIARKLSIENWSFARIHEPELNIMMGSWYLSYLIALFGNEETAVAAYNAGRGNVSRWLADSEHSQDGQTLSSIPFPETAAYVNKVSRDRAVYQIILKLFGVV